MFVYSLAYPNNISLARGEQEFREIEVSHSRVETLIIYAERVDVVNKPGKSGYVLTCSS